jgi:hypothetical protein
MTYEVGLVYIKFFEVSCESITSIYMACSLKASSLEGIRNVKFDYPSCD